MLYGIVGTLSDVTGGRLIRGNGKTATLTYILKNMYNNSKVYTNYKTTFSTMFDTIEIAKILDEIKDENIKQNEPTKSYGIGIDEIQIFTNSYDRISKKDLSFTILKLIQQSRHKSIDILYTAQRYMDVHRRVRVQTDNYFIPTKYHLDGRICNIDHCFKDHIIIVKNLYDTIKPFYFNIKDISSDYDTEEIIE